MSIYPVRLAEWYPKEDEHHEFMKTAVKFVECLECGKTKMRWQTAYGHHSIPWGHGDVWCTKKCYKRYFKPTKENK